MPITIGPNIASLRASRLLNRSSDALATTFQRLSSGLRINRAADDPAGLAIASSLEANSRIYTQGIKNLNDGLSVLSVAQSGLESMGTIVTRLQELATQASNGVLSQKQRQAINTESDALVNEYNRIVASTTFNGNAILDPTQGTNSFVLQGGAGTANSTAVTIGNAIDHLVGSGTFADPTSFAVTSTQVVGLVPGDVNGDGKIDLAVGGDTGWILIGNGDGTFAKALSFGASRSVSLVDLNHDGKLDLVYDVQNQTNSVVRLGNGDGTFASGITYANGSLNVEYLNLVDLNSDGNLDIVNSSWNGVVGIALGNSDGSFNKPTSLTITASSSNYAGDTVTGDFNNDGDLDLITIDTANNKVYLSIGNGDGTFLKATSFSSNGTGPRYMAVGDFNNDGNQDFVVTNLSTASEGIFIGNGDGTFKLGTTFSFGTYPASYGGKNLIADLNGDGYADIYQPTKDTNGYIALSNGDGTFKAPYVVNSNFAGPNAYDSTVADVNGDGVPDLVTAFNVTSIEVLKANAINVATIKHLNLSTQSTAQQALTYLSNQQSLVSQELGNVGAYQSRIGFQINNLISQKLEYDNAYSRIMTADIATESAELVKQNVMRNAASGILAQANQQPLLVLKLLDFSK